MNHLFESDIFNEPVDLILEFNSLIING